MTDSLNDSTRLMAGLTSTSAPPTRPPAHAPLPIGHLRLVTLAVRRAMMAVRNWYCRRILGMDIHPSCRFSLTAKLDHTNPRGVHIGEGTYLAFRSVVLSHDMSRLIHTHTRIGKNCFIGAHAIVLPGVTIGDECIIGCGAVVTHDVPSGSVCAGNPARVIKSGIHTVQFGILADAYHARLRDGGSSSPTTSP